MAVRATLTGMRFVPHGTGRTVMRQAVMGKVWALLTEMARARRTRRLLGEMDDRMLADIGIGRGDALMEAARAPWDLHERR